MRPPHQVDGGGGLRLVHGHHGRAVAIQTVPGAECVAQGGAECREDVFDEVVLVDLEISAGQELEVGACLEREQGQQVVEESDPVATRA